MYNKSKSNIEHLSFRGNDDGDKDYYQIPRSK